MILHEKSGRGSICCRPICILRDLSQCRILNTKEIIVAATTHLRSLPGHVFNSVVISKPISVEAAVNLSRIVSKQSPFVGNTIEFNAVEFLNSQSVFNGYGRWRRQDPDFPDTVFEGTVYPVPGIEIKAWFPLATEITARFKASQNRFTDDSIYICMLAWLPQHLIYGVPYIADVLVVPGLSVAVARDNHYHNPPDYLVIEPGDTSARTRNLQQSNTSGYKWQGGPEEFDEAAKIVESWGPTGRTYKPSRDYQHLLLELLARYSYRLDTNFAKMDRIAHPEIEGFKTRVGQREVNGMPIREWRRIFANENETEIRETLRQHLEI